jgi:diguanylate cyclase (GGDEF)-like protein
MSTLALTDPLTSLANRRQFLDQLQREFNRSKRYRRPLSLLYVDLDGFKEINDHFGHIYGDEVLCGVARSMLSALRASDLLARIGGDEFAVLLPETKLQGALEVSKKLRKALSAYSRRTSLETSLPPLTFCAGVSQRHDRDQSIDDMLARADGAQYLAKATGKAHTRVESEIS